MVTPLSPPPPPPPPDTWRPSRISLWLLTAVEPSGGDSSSSREPSESRQVAEAGRRGSKEQAQQVGGGEEVKDHFVRGILKTAAGFSVACALWKPVFADFRAACLRYTVQSSKPETIQIFTVLLQSLMVLLQSREILYSFRPWAFGVCGSELSFNWLLPWPKIIYLLARPVTPT